MARDAPDEIRGVTVADQEIPANFTSDPRIYGGAEVSNDELSILSLPPNYALYGNIDQKECEIEVEKALAKARWSLKNQEREEEQETGNEQRKRKVFDHETETFNFQEMRGTDLPFNKRITLPPPLNIDTEVKLRTLGVNLKKAIEAASQEKIDTNLSKQQSDGLRKLKERVKNREVVVFQTDKSGRFSIDTPEN